jgi:hypothetical protein
MARSAGLLDVIDDAYLARGDWLPEAREFAELLQSAERERCAKYLRDAAARLAPEGKRINQIDRHTAHILACKGDELAAGYASTSVSTGIRRNAKSRSAGLRAPSSAATLLAACNWRSGKLALLIKSPWQDRKSNRPPSKSRRRGRL